MFRVQEMLTLFCCIFYLLGGSFTTLRLVFMICLAPVIVLTRYMVRICKSTLSVQIFPWAPDTSVLLCYCKIYNKKKPLNYAINNCLPQTLSSLISPTYLNISLHYLSELLYPDAQARGWAIIVPFPDILLPLLYINFPSVINLYLNSFKSFSSYLHYYSLRIGSRYLTIVTGITYLVSLPFLSSFHIYTAKHSKTHIWLHIPY